MSKLKAKKYIRFSFPMAASGEDPDNPGKIKTGIIYCHLNFKTPADARAVKKAIAKLVKKRYGRAVPKAVVNEMFNLGVQHTHEIVSDAQGTLDKMSSDPDFAKSIAVQAQANAIKQMEQEEPEV